MILFTHLCGTWRERIDFACESSVVLRLFYIGLCEAHSKASLTIEFQQLFILEKLLFNLMLFVVLFFIIQFVEIKLRICFFLLLGRVRDLVILRYWSISTVYFIWLLIISIVVTDTEGHSRVQADIFIFIMLTAALGPIAVIAVLKLHLDRSFEDVPVGVRIVIALHKKPVIVFVISSSILVFLRHSQSQEIKDKIFVAILNEIAQVVIFKVIKLLIVEIELIVDLRLALRGRILVAEPIENCRGPLIVVLQ